MGKGEEDSANCSSHETGGAMGSAGDGEGINGDAESNQIIAPSAKQDAHDVHIIIPHLQPSVAALPSSAPHLPQPLSPPTRTTKPNYVSRKKKVVGSVIGFCKAWLRHPLNIALLLWLLPVVFFLTLLFLLLTGLVDDLFPTDATRDRWIEICNQVLNMLFTLLSLSQHPVLFHHLAMVCRWRYPDDVVALRRVYCKVKGSWGGVNERAHMAVVVALLHVACLAQYVLCGLYWGYTSEERPEFSDDICDVVGIVAPVLAAVYTSYSPLGRGPGQDPDDEESRAGTYPVLKYHDGEKPLAEGWHGGEWESGPWDCGDDPKGCALSLFCAPCVFGYNTSRLGLGNAHVHAATLLLLCVAPFWVCGITALNVRDHDLRRGIRVAGVLMCPLGLLYGGFWRVQLRQRLRIHGRRVFRWAPRSARDYLGWVFCWPCSLAQEVRTGDLYLGLEGGSSRGGRGSCGESGEDGESTKCHSPSSPVTPGISASPVATTLADTSHPSGRDAVLAAPGQPMMIVPEAEGDVEELQVPLLSSSEIHQDRLLGH